MVHVAESSRFFFNNNFQFVVSGYTPSVTFLDFGFLYFGNHQQQQSLQKDK
jgi:hypothetical protein